MFPKLFSSWTIFCGHQLYVTLLLSPDSLTIMMIKLLIQIIRQCDGWACFALHNSSSLGAICDKQTRRSDSTFSLDLYFVFILVSAENAFSHIWRCIPQKMEVSSKKIGGQHLLCCRNCVIRDPFHRHARVTFHNFAEVNFRDFLLVRTDVLIGTYDRSSYAG